MIRPRVDELPRLYANFEALPEFTTGIVVTTPRDSVPERQ